MPKLRSIGMPMLEHVDELVEFPCPACGLVARVGYADFDDDDPAPSGTPAILHALPYCERFEQIETMDDFVAYMRDAAPRRTDAKV